MKITDKTKRIVLRLAIMLGGIVLGYFIGELIRSL